MAALEIIACTKKDQKQNKSNPKAIFLPPLKVFVKTLAYILPLACASLP
jgi:hypothetical protein